MIPKVHGLTVVTLANPLAPRTCLRPEKQPWKRVVLFQHKAFARTQEVRSTSELL